MEWNYFKSTVHKERNQEYLFPTLRIARVTAGVFEWQIGSHAVSLRAGDVVLLNNLTPRRIQSREQVELDIFEFSPAELRLRPGLMRAFYRPEPAVFDRPKGLNTLLSLLIEARPTVQKTEFFDHLMQAVFDLLEEETGELCPSPEIAFRAAEYIWEHFAEDLSVPGVAKRLNVSKSHLEKSFREVFGVGVGGYIRAIRVHRAVVLLEKEPDRSVLELALACGFNSSSGFYKAYRSVVGMKPRRK